MTRKANFNWLELSRLDLYKILYTAKQQIVGKELPRDDLHKILSRHIKNALPIRIRKVVRNTVDFNLIYIGGAYYPEYDVKNNLFLEINFHYNTNSTFLKITEYRWNRLCLLFADTVLHELIHAKQYRRRNFYPGRVHTAANSAQFYYGAKDEIDAYSFNIACQLVDKFSNNIRDIRKYINSKQRRKNRHCLYQQYLTVFDYKHSHPVIKELKIKIIKNLPNALHGKPFKYSKFLTY